MNFITKDSDKALPFDVDDVSIAVSKHFERTWMRK